LIYFCKKTNQIRSLYRTYLLTILLPTVLIAIILKSYRIDDFQKGGVLKAWKHIQHWWNRRYWKSYQRIWDTTFKSIW